MNLRVISLILFNFHIFKQCGTLLSSHLQQQSSPQMWVIVLPCKRKFFHPHILVLAPSTLSLHQRNTRPNLCQDPFNTRSRSNLSSNHKLWNHSWIMRRVRIIYYIEPIIITKVFWTPHFNQNFNTFWFMCPYLYTVQPFFFRNLRL